MNRIRRKEHEVAAAGAGPRPRLGRLCQTQPGPPPVALLAASSDPASREDLGKPPTLWLYQGRRNSCPDTDEHQAAEDLTTAAEARADPGAELQAQQR